ncbi:TonB-dependent receptor [Azoarcus sp. TTM-91]|nr:TonB-dependent receptor [Azoarcus sp. TTM-91]NMG34262.1 TonB-dependent receptor [Azoarcus sp. TTM-91]
MLLRNTALPTSRRRPRLLSLLLAGCAFPAFAAQATDDAVELSTIEVKGQASDSVTAAYSSTRQESTDIREHRVSQAQQLFRNVPGMNLTGYGLPGVGDAISLRGFGGGGHGGDIGFVVDGIPLNEAMSHADGYADLNVIVPLELDNMTVLRGPVSALYGNYNRAGTVTLQTRKGGEYQDADISIGSFGTVDLQGAAGVALNDSQRLNLAAQVYHSDGFRDQSKSDRATLAGRWSLKVSPELEIAVSGRAHEAESDNPGYITLAQFKDDPYGKDPRTKNDGAEKSFYTLRTDVNYRLSSEVKLLTFAYATQQDFTRWFSRGSATAPTWRQREETYDRGVLGAGFNLNGQHAFTAGPLTWVAGVEHYRERTDYLKYEDIQYRRRVDTAEYDRHFELNNLAIFGEAGIELHPLFKPSIGLRWDRFTGDCGIEGAETATDECRNMKSVTHTSPKIGVRSQVADNVELRASWAEGFALAPDMAKYAIGVNNVNPNVFRQTEVGANIKIGSQIVLDLAAYHLKSSDEISEISPGEYVNAGSTRRTGFETSLLWLPTEQFDLSLTYGSAHTRIVDNPDSSLEGKRVTSVPRYTATLEANWRPVANWRASATWRKIGSYAVSSDNSQTYRGYDTLDLGLSYTFSGQRRTTIYLAVDNVTDREYATAVSTIGYATGAPRTFRVGAQLSF